MLSSIANSRPARLAVPVVMLAAAACLARPLERSITSPGTQRTEQLAGLAGRGHLLAVFGGLRAPLAGGFWLRANAAWEHCDAAATVAFIELAVAADERPLCFWLNGARMIACDLPEWEPPAAPAAVRRKVSEAQADRALRFLEKGLRWHGADAALFVEIANIHLRRLGDAEAAARYYRLAAEQPGAPYYAARIHGELLRALGRPEEALRWLREIAPGLPAGDQAARRELVLGRIEELERELGERRGGLGR